MIEDKLKLLSHPSMIHDKLDTIIEAFVEFYGEEKRANIEQKLRNVLIVKFCNNENLAQIITDIEEELFREIFEQEKDFFYYLKPEEMIEALENGDSDNYIYLTDDIKKVCFNGEEEIKTIIENYRKGLYPKVNEYIKKYKELNEKLKQYKERFQKEEKRISEIDAKYFDILVNEFSYLFPVEDLETYKKLNMTVGMITKYLGSSVTSTPHAFAPKNQELLNDPNASSWKKTSIEGDRILFLKKHGFNLATEEDLFNEPSYEEYLKNPECLKFIEETKKLFERIEKRKQELNEQRVKEIVYDLQDYKECEEIISEKNYVNKNDALGPFVYQSPVSCCEMNFIKVGEQYIPYPLVLVNAGMSNIEITTIHELNHAYENHVLQVTDQGSVSITGWDVETNVFKDKKEPEELEYKGITRPYELMSEYINDRIAEDIRDIMQSKGQYIFNKEEDKRGSSYRYVDFILEKFYQSFKPIIIESRSHGNIQYIYDMLGRENFEQLNNLVNKYYEKFAFTLNGRMAVIDYINNEPNEHKEFIEQLINERNIIIENMNHHLVLQNNSIQM